MSKGKVLMAMSGGVDSSVAAWLLREQGYDVIGATMLMWDGSEGSAVKDAKRVCDQIEIPHIQIDVRVNFRAEVMDYYCAEYQSGRTPNPCVVCNKKIKFGEFFDYANTMGADYIATGHYARVVATDCGLCLKKGVDTSKDQSYFLYNLTQEHLQKIIFPIGDKLKEEVRKIALEQKLPVANRKESQDICFDLKLTSSEGDIVDDSGKVVGRHSGLANYTVGQRRGIRVSAKEPLYVIGMDVAGNKLIVGGVDQIWGDELEATEVNWICPAKGDSMRVKAKVRYGARETNATVSILGESKVHVKFDKKVRAITPGQSVVFYKEDLIIGGGVIS